MTIMADENANLYHLLGVPSTATKAEIKNAYREIAKRLHPDRNPPAAAEQQFKLISSAYDTLTDGMPPESLVCLHRHLYSLVLPKSVK